jgi:hypothetical protein
MPLTSNHPQGIPFQTIGRAQRLPHPLRTREESQRLVTTLAEGLDHRSEGVRSPSDWTILLYSSRTMNRNILTMNCE